MNPPSFDSTILRRPERLQTLIHRLETEPGLAEFRDVAEVASMCLASSATNDYLEKIGALSIGATHSSSKLGADGILNGDGVEVKPFKKSPGTKSVAVINDDTPMKLLKSHETEKWLVLLCANKQGTQVQYAICAPFHYWETSRYQAILKKLKLDTDPSWTWGSELPLQADQRLACLKELVTKHKEGTYVRSSSLSLDVIQKISKEELSFWKHPDLAVKKLHPILRNL